MSEENNLAAVELDRFGGKNGDEIRAARLIWKKERDGVQRGQGAVEEETTGARVSVAPTRYRR